MFRNKTVSYNPKLKGRARELRKNSTLAEVLLWKQIKGKSMRCEFHRQVPVGEFIVDFYCHELQVAIEIDGCSHEGNYAYDKSRQMDLEDKGIQVIRFKDSDVKRNMNGVLIELREEIRQRIKAV